MMMRVFSGLIGWLPLYRALQERAERAEVEAKQLRARLATTEEEARCKADDLRAELGFAREREASARRELAATADVLGAVGDELERATRERDAARALLTRLTPRTYREGDPRPKAPMWWARGGGCWKPLPADLIEQDDIYIDLPPPDAWPQPWTGSTGPLDPAQQHAYDALEKVTQERDALREAHREAQEALRDQEAATAKVTQERDAARTAQATAEAARAAAEQVQCDLARERDRTRAELARLREQATHRTYSNGEPKPDDVVLWWDCGRWVRIAGCDLDHGDRWFPLPPPPDEESPR